MSVHWPIIQSWLTNATQVATIDERGSRTGLKLLAGSLFIAGEIDRRSSTSTVGIMLPSSAAFPVAAVAAWMLGKTVVPLNFLLKPEELDYVVQNCGCDTLVTSRALIEHMGHTPPLSSGPRGLKHIIYLEDIDFTGFPDPRWPKSADPEDLAVILYTSGTSGKPKGVMLTHGNLCANVEQVWRWVDFSRRDVMFGILPQFHSFGLTVLTILPMSAGMKVIYAPRFVPQRVIRAFREHRPTVFVAIPSMYNALLSVKDAGPEDFASFRYVVSGGEPLSETVLTQFRERFGVTICEGYGLTETSPVTNWCRPHEWKPRCVGKPLPMQLERIVDVNTGRLMPTGHDGEVQIAGPNVMKGYFNLPEQTAAVFTADHYFRTGDIGRFDEEGRLYITGRLKEMLIVGGENVFPREIEEAIDSHPSVHASGVVGLPDPMRGEVPIAFVELKEGQAFDEKAILTWCRQRLAGYKVPGEVRCLPALPRNPTGKIMRRELKKLI